MMNRLVPRNKKAEENIMEKIIFLILNLAFFVIMLLFVNSSGNREFVYEQIYAKEIALIIDNAKPEMAMLLDVSKLVELAKDNDKDVNEIIKLDKENNRVFISLRGTRGYSYKYFSDADIELKLQGELLSISIT